MGMGTSAVWMRQFVWPIAAAGLAACSYPALPPVGDRVGDDDGDGGTGAQAHAALDWQVSTSPTAMPTFMPISPAPTVRIAELPGDPTAALPALAAPDGGYGAEGTIALPADYAMHAWRLEYTLADGVPHELQWQPDAGTMGHLTVPLFGRPDRSPPPAGSGYTITETGAAPTVQTARVFTTGLWTEGLVPSADFSGFSMNYDFSNSQSMSGSLGSPIPGEGDHAIAISYATDGNGCLASNGAIQFDPTLQANVHSAVTSAWDLTNHPITVGSINSAPSRFSALGNLSDSFLTSASFIQIGAAASLLMPGLTRAPSSLVNTTLPSPVMVTLLSCQFGDQPTTAAKPTALVAFPTVLHVQLIDTRTALGVTLINGLETVAPAGINGDFTATFPAPFAQQIMLKSPTKGPVALDGSDPSLGNTDQIDVGTATGTYTLQFTPEQTTGLRGDYYDVIVHQIAAGDMTTERIYTVPAPTLVNGPQVSVRIDGATLTPGADYVFEIRSYKGHPNATHGDFSVVDYPYGSAIVSTHTFKLTAP
jgi:hypothetical protein